MDDRTVVVTGASRGIGRAVAAAFAAAGARVIVCARDRSEVERVAAELDDDGGDVRAMRADVRDQFDLERLMETAASEGGRIDTVVVNAGVYHGSPGETPLTEEDYSTFDDHVRTNGRGAFATIREALPHLGEDARILVSSGAVAREESPGYGSYAVSKATAEAVARGFSADTEYAVGVVDPGYVATDLSGDRGHDPEDVAGQFLWAATEAPAEAVDGEVVDRRDWRTAQRG